jgi:DNA polymerase
MPVMTATVHPSSILRAPDDETQALEMQAFIVDLRKVAEYNWSLSSRSPSPWRGG